MKDYSICFFVAISLTMMQESSAIVEDDVLRVFWDGVGMYIPVTRDAVQEKIDQWHERNADTHGDSPMLFLPKYRVFPELMSEDQHPLYIDFGGVAFLDFDDGGNKENPVVYGNESAVSIPLLTADPDGPPRYSLALALFYESSRGDFPKPNIHYPYIPADKISLDDKGASVQIGCEEMRVTFERQKHPCEPPPALVSHEFDEFIKEDLHFGTPKPHFRYCDSHPTERNRLCDNAEKLKCAVSRFAPNLCQFWRSTSLLSCALTIDTFRVTDYFRRLLPFADADPINVVSSQTYFGNFSVGVKYPCID